MKSRSLRAEGDTCGTKNRETAEALAFDLWQQALVAETEARVRLEARNRAQERARAYADLVDRLRQRAGRLVVRQPNKSKRSKLCPQPSSRSRLKSCGNTNTEHKSKKHAAQSPSNPMLVSPGIDLETSIVKTTRCDCCHTPFIPEIELSQIDSGQSLCAKCMYYLREAGDCQKRVSTG